MNTYKAFYNKLTAFVKADTSYKAYEDAIKLFKVPKSKQHMVSVCLVELDGKPYEHSTASI